MSVSEIPQSIEAVIEGDVYGQVAVGNNILQIGSIHGGVVQLLSPGERPNVRPRPMPVSLRPRAFRNLLDRVSEITTAASALEEGIPTEFFGPAGLGKTALLRHFAHHPLGTSLTGGVVYLTARRQPMEDLLQSLYDAFYQSDIPFKPSEAEIRHSLRDIRALIILDDLQLDHQDARNLMDFVPHSRFLVASRQQTLLGEGKPLALSGLPIEDAVVLLERELGRSSLSADERQSAVELCTALGGHPQQVLQAAAVAREERLSITMIAESVKGGLPVEALTARYAKSLPEREQRLLLLLASLRGAPLDPEAAAAITATPEAKKILEGLERRGLVHSDEHGYMLVTGTSEELRKEWEAGLGPWFKMAGAYFAKWAADNKGSPERVVDRLEPQISALEWAEKNQEWESVLDQVRAVEGSLALTGRWGGWRTILDAGLKAAHSIGDQISEAWAYHQLGTRALGLEEASAPELLAKALQIREGIADQLGAAVTRQNLAVLHGAPPPPVRLPDAPSPSAPIVGASTLVKVAGVVALVAAGVAAGGLGIYAAATAMGLVEPTAVVIATDPSETATGTPSSTPVPSNTATREPTATATSTRTATATASATFTPTSTPSVTPTPTLGPPMVTGLQSANCRRGPSTVYKIIGALLRGEISLIDGRNASSTWWWIDNPDGGVNCYVWDELVALKGDITRVPIVPDPPTPTHTPSPTLTPSPTVCSTLTITSLTATKNFNLTVTVRWNSVGGCGPFTGFISASYPIAPFSETYTIGTKSGSVNDTPPPNCGGADYTARYTLNLRDNSGQSVWRTTSTAIPPRIC